MMATAIRSFVLYSTPCLFSAQAAMEKAMNDLKVKDGALVDSPVSLTECSAVLSDNLAHRDSKA